ncbi:MAG: Nif3-like dinuclear metal center hexameric protein [Deltaproteobacteria bacterium]|nr:MAG: Nif3-like dinuclear metal center hexameric protein [Deltaproteobacteria bacterium]
MRTARVQDLLGLLHGWYPPDQAEEWDNVGLQVGEATAAVEKLMIALDPSAAAVAAASAAGARLLVTHHPLLFKPLRRLTPDDPVGGVIWTAVRDGVAIAAAHTNLDVAADGLNRWLAARLDLLEAVPLQPAVGHLVKLAVFVPTAHAESVADALFAGGAGQIGAYDQCSFRVAGTGTFRPGPGTAPFIGEAGRREQVEEVRLETIVPQRRLPRVLEKMLKAHPYEEVAYDLVPLANELPGVGLGRIGRLAEPVALAAFAARVKAALGCSSLRLVGVPERTVAKVAVCGGSGAGLIHEARRRGAEVLVTGDVKYHEARLAEDLGIALLDAGHFATERLAVEELAERFRAGAAERGWRLDVVVFEGDRDPFVVY